MIKSNFFPTIVMEVVTGPEVLARARAQAERFERNWTWFKLHDQDICDSFRGKCICIAGQELFVADTIDEVLALATAAHPEDDGRFAEYIPRKRMIRIY